MSFLDKFKKQSSSHDFANEIENISEQANQNDADDPIDEAIQKQIADGDFNSPLKDVDEMSATTKNKKGDDGKKAKVNLAIIAVVGLLIMLVGIGLAAARWQDSREEKRVTEAEEQAQAQKKLATGTVNIEDDKANIENAKIDNAKWSELPPPAAAENNLGADGLPITDENGLPVANTNTDPYPAPVTPTYTAEPNPAPAYEPPVPVTPTYTAEPNPTPVYEAPTPVIPTYVPEPEPKKTKKVVSQDDKQPKQQEQIFNPIAPVEVEEAPVIKGADSHVMVDINRNKKRKKTAKATKTKTQKDSNNGVGGKLQPTVLVDSKATRRKQQSLLMKKGTIIPCVLKTKIDSTYKGFVTCQTSRDVYSTNGKTLLIERGSQVFGEQNIELKQGQARVTVLWNRIETPKGVVVNINSPTVGKMGQMGVGAKVNNHYTQRFGAAILLSVIQGALNVGFSKLTNNESSNSNSNDNTSNSNSANNTAVNDTKKTANDISQQALKHSIDIEPTATVNAGTLLNIMVVRDVDFNDVYKLSK